ncbi:hypothetical protein FA15DRAFT_633867 [Coprinopsis marcescibilis]|uniref:Uncharacterized protein n=1 Tax=Coprinopsis marcescibilis TaxID=230819 RepID=A0A5C3L713_COPMA|nr:hypothetical protein FA15DRAFT_633867 [Coprinopsis marcescibilis]
MYRGTGKSLRLGIMAWSQYAVLFCHLCSLRVDAFSWPSSGLKRTGDAYISDERPTSSGSVQSEVAALSREPDCFHRVGKALEFRCGEADLRQPERVTAAIAMTLCEVSTAKHYSIPLECGSFTADNLSVSRPKPAVQGSCVDALSRSTQLWSSYSGYMREIRTHHRI